MTDAGSREIKLEAGLKPQRSSSSADNNVRHFKVNTIKWYMNHNNDIHICFPIQLCTHCEEGRIELSCSDGWEGFHRFLCKSLSITFLATHIPSPFVLCMQTHTCARMHTHMLAHKHSGVSCMSTQLCMFPPPVGLPRDCHPTLAFPSNLTPVPSFSTPISFVLPECETEVSQVVL